MDTAETTDKTHILPLDKLAATESPGGSIIAGNGGHDLRLICVCLSLYGYGERRQATGIAVCYAIVRSR